MKYERSYLGALLI